MGVKIKDVDTSRLTKRFLVMQRRASDFRPVFRWVQQALQDAHRMNFATNGLTGGAPWAPHDPEYAAWRLENGYGGKGMLVRDGTLKFSLTNMNSARGVSDIGRRTATFGTRVPFAKYHQTGTRFMPQRKIIFVNSVMALRTANVVSEYIMHGTVGVLYSDAMKGFSI